MKNIIHYFFRKNICYHLGLEVDLTRGVRPSLKRFLDLLRLTMLKMILWSVWTFSTVKLNQNLHPSS